MITTSLITMTLISCAISYVVCGIPFGLLISSRAAKLDVRKVGSGNIGTTNVARSVGKGAAVATLLCDAGKGALCTLFAGWLISTFGTGGNSAMILPTGAWGWTMTLTYLACICGHVYSPYLGFHGGKGIAVGFGAALGFMWPVAIGMLVVFCLAAIPSRYVSLGSVTAAAALPFLGFFIYRPEFSFVVPLIIVSVIVIAAHRGNIVKLAHGEESKFAFHHDGGSANA